MKFLCGSCRTKYQISDEKVRGKVLTIRCRKCGSKVVVKESLARQGMVAMAPVSDGLHASEQETPANPLPKSPTGKGAAASIASAFDAAMAASLDDVPTSIAPMPPRAMDAGVEWYVASGGQQRGPLAYPELIRQLQSGEVTAQHYVWHDRMDAWKRAQEIAELVPYVAPAPPAKKPPPPPLSPAQEPLYPGPEDLPTPAMARAPVARRTESRLKELDGILEGALGIPIEQAKTPVLSAESFAQDKSSDGFNPERLFEQVPRTSPAELLSRESTRFFVAAAGVDSQKRNTKVGLFAGLGAVAAALAFVGLWATGVIQVSLPGIGNPFASKSKLHAEEELSAKELSDADRRRLEELLGSGDSRRAALAKLAAERKRPGARQKGVPDGAYVVSSRDEKAPTGSRQPEAEGVRFGDLPETGTALEKPELPVEVAGGNPKVQPVATRRLEQRAVQQIFADGSMAVKVCYQRELRGNESLRGKLDFEVIVEPAGDVSRVVVMTPAFKGSKLASCISDKIREWKFPAFDGAAQPVAGSFVLDRASYN